MAARKRQGPPQRGPGEYYRQGVSLMELFDKFPDNETAEQWFVDPRWPAGVRCPQCDSENVQERASRKPQPSRCRSCRKDFSVKTRSVMQRSNLGFRIWVVAVHLVATGLKRTSSMKLHRDLDISPKSAWHLAHRIRENWGDQHGLLDGPVEMDEAFFGGLKQNKHPTDRRHACRGTVGKAAIAGTRGPSNGEDQRSRRADHRQGRTAWLRRGRGA